MRPTSITGGELFRRWATKKAANVAATSTRKVTRATSGIAPIRLLTLVEADDDGDVDVLLRVGQQCLRCRVERHHRLDPERVRGLLGGGFGAALEHHDRHV